MVAAGNQIGREDFRLAAAWIEDLDISQQPLGAAAADDVELLAIGHDRMAVAARLQPQVSFRRRRKRGATGQQEDHRQRTKTGRSRADTHQGLLSNVFMSSFSRS